MSGQPGPEIITFGCRLNAYESEVMRDNALAAGLSNAIIVNTCAVTGEAMRQARQAIRKARRQHPDAQLIVTGCGAQVDPAMFADMKEVDHVIGNAEKMKPQSFVDLAIGSAEKVQVNDIFSVTETAGHLIEGFEGKARAFVQIQNGCNHRCTFCIIPYGRGNSRSVPAGEVVDQIRRLVDNGYGEVVLSGVDITSWGADMPGAPTLGRLVQQILIHVPDLPRLRISSIDSIEVDAPLFEAMVSEQRLMPHLHLSLQAGDNMILKRMKRRHSREDAIRFCTDIRARRPDIVFGADIIAGFPTETDEMFAQSMALVSECDLTWLHVFPYSEREGTPAARMPQLPHSVRKERAARLRALGDRQVERFLDAQCGKTVPVLIERRVESGGQAAALGHSPHFAPVHIEGAWQPGDMVTVTIAGRDGSILRGRPLSDWRDGAETKADVA